MSLNRAERRLWREQLLALRAERDIHAEAWRSDNENEPERRAFLAAQAAYELHQMLKPKLVR